MVAGTAIPAGSTDNTPPGNYTDFTTNFPDAVGDPNLMPLLEAKNVEVNVETASPWVGLLISNGLPLLLLLGAMIWLGRSASRASRAYSVSAAANPANT